MTLVEVMVSVGVLSVGLLGLTSLYTTSIRSITETQQRSIALRAAAQRAETLATLRLDDLPVCRGATGGCREGGGAGLTPELAPDGAFECTRWADGADVGDPAQVGSRPRLRIDTQVTVHPDAARHPDARLVTVSVCWRDAQALVHEVQAQRLVIPEL